MGWKGGGALAMANKRRLSWGAKKYYDAILCTSGEVAFGKRQIFMLVVRGRMSDEPAFTPENQPPKFIFITLMKISHFKSELPPKFI